MKRSAHKTVFTINFHVLHLYKVEQDSGLVALSSHVQNIHSVCVDAVDISIALVNKDSDHIHEPVEWCIMKGIEPILMFGWHINPVSEREVKAQNVSFGMVNQNWNQVAFVFNHSLNEKSMAFFRNGSCNVKFLILDNLQKFFEMFNPSLYVVWTFDRNENFAEKLLFAELV
jgi:hypothetical protein